MKSLKVNALWAHLALLTVNLIYGANFTIAKAIMPRFIEPLGFIFFRVFISLLLYGALYRLFFYEPIARNDIPRLALCGIFGIALNQMMFFKGISLTSSVHGSLLMIMTPIFTMIVAAIILKDRPTNKKIIGIILGISGAAFLILATVQSWQDPSMMGDLCVIINAISYAIYLVIVKPLMSRYQPMTVIFYNFLFGFFWVAIFGWDQASQVDFAAIPSFYYTHFAFVILGATFLVYLLNVMAMSSVSPTVVSSYIFVQPLFAILISVIFAGEHLGFSTIVGGISIIFGVWLINRN